MCRVLWEDDEFSLPKPSPPPCNQVSCRKFMHISNTTICLRLSQCECVCVCACNYLKDNAAINYATFSFHS